MSKFPDHADELQLDDILRKFRKPNVRDFFASMPEDFKDIVNHKPVTDFVDCDLHYRLSPQGLVSKLKPYGLVHIVDLPFTDIENLDTSLLEPVVDGSREFRGPWTSCVCLDQRRAIFAFTYEDDAVLFRMHI